MLKPKKLSFCNIGRFITPQTIYFDRLSQLNQIDAENNLTGGSSGSGKSTIPKAHDWLLGLNNVSTNVLQSRLTKEQIWVEGEYDWDGKNVLIKRAKKLSITVDGIETTGSSKITEELLDTLLGMSRELFHKIVHRQQGENGFFLQQTPAQMNSFLTDCLNLVPIRSKIDLIDDKIANVFLAKNEAQSGLQALQAALDATKSAQSSLGQKPMASVTEVLVEGYKSQYEDSNAVLQALLGSNQLEKDALQATKPKLTVIPYDRTQIDALETEIKSLELKINIELDKERSRQLEVNSAVSANKLKANSEISALKLEQGKKIAESKTTFFNLSTMIKTGRDAKDIAIQLAAEIKILREGSCHTCNQPWSNELSKAEEQKLLNKLDECKIDIEASVFATKETEDFKSALSLVNQRINSDIAAITDKMNADITGLEEQAKPQVSLELTFLKEKTLELAKQKTAEFIKEDAHKTEQNHKNQKLLEAFFLEQKAFE